MQELEQEAAMAVQAALQVLGNASPASEEDLCYAAQALRGVRQQAGIDARYQRHVLLRHLFREWSDRIAHQDRMQRGLPAELKAVMLEPGVAFEFWPCSWEDEHKNTLGTEELLHLVYTVGLELELVGELQLMPPSLVSYLLACLSTTLPLTLSCPEAFAVVARTFGDDFNVRQSKW
jgi:hypothetical protein